MNPTFLSREEVVVLTGFKSKSKQVRYLINSGVPFFLSAHGVPNIPRTSIESPSQKATPNPPARWTPKIK